MSSYGILKVKEKATGKEIWIKVARFNSQFHEKIVGESVKQKEYLVEPNKPIILNRSLYLADQMKKVVENAQKKEEINPVEEVKLVIDEIIEEPKKSIDEMKMSELRSLAKSKGLIIATTTKKAEILLKLKEIGVS